MIVWLEGAFRDEAEAAIPIDDRGFLHADGVFETALCLQGGFFRLDEHLERFRGSAATLRLPVPAARELEHIARDLVRRNALTDASLRFTLTRGTDRPRLLVTARAPDPAWTDRAARGWRLITAATRRPSPAAIPAQLKALGRTYALLARFEAADAGVDDALLLTDQGAVCEGPTWNVFWRTGETLFTPAIDLGVLAGVTRRALLECAATLPWNIREGTFDRAVLDHADEILASMTSVGVVRIRELDGRTLPANTPAADALAAAYADLLHTETARDYRRHAE